MADDEGRHQHKSHHFLVVAYGVQSHVNPSRVLAHRLTQLSIDGSVSVLATLSVLVAAHRRMFPYVDGDTETTDGVISYVPHSDGLDDGSMAKDAEDRARRRRASTESLSTIVARLANRGRPVTCIICTMVSPPVLDVAREHGIPLAVYWIQPATVLAVSYHYFHGYGEVVASHAVDPAYEVCLPGLNRPPLRISSFPSFLVDTSGSEMSKAINDVFRELFEYIDQWRPKILLNTFNELEENAVIEMKQHLDMSVVGPMVGSSKEERIHLFKHDDTGKKRFMEWLGAQEEKSVVYVSFGSITKQTKKQMEEIVRGLQQCGRPYLLVLRKDGLEDDNDDDSHSLENNAHSQRQGMVVDWCNQLDVLSHPAVGCFVSHCGWNSTIEAVASGVPVIGVPNMFDQPTNIHLVEEWGVGVRGERNSDGLLTGTELARCIGLVMDEGDKAMVIREKARALKELAQAAGNIGGSSERNLLDFVKTISS